MIHELKMGKKAGKFGMDKRSAMNSNKINSIHGKGNSSDAISKFHRGLAWL